MSRTRLSTTVDADLLESARRASGKPARVAASTVTASPATSYADTVSTASIDALPQSPHELVV